MGKFKVIIFIKNKNNGIEIIFFKKKYFVKLITLSKNEIENLSCAISCCICLNIKINDILKIIKKVFKPPWQIRKNSR